MFNAPEVIKNIPEISKIYEINEKQENELQNAIERINDNFYFDSMDEETTEKEEEVLNILPFDGDTLENRRMNVKIKKLENKNYTYRQILKSLYSLLGQDYDLLINDNKTEVKLNINQFCSAKKIKSAGNFLDNSLPLNMIFVLSANCKVGNTQIVSGGYIHTGEVRTLRVGKNRNYPLIAIAGESLIISADDDVTATDEDGHLIITAYDLEFSAENGHIYVEREE